MSVSQMTSLRIPEEHLMLLDQRVGFDGMRNRSDVIRAAIHNYLDSTPSNADVRTVKFEIGRVTIERLELIYRLHGDDRSIVAKKALDEYIAKMSKPDKITEALRERLETARDNTQSHEDHTA
jgi:Arc/MetJ-type ribon-helix-helix transcriptional regulator